MKYYLSALAHEGGFAVSCLNIGVSPLSTGVTLEAAFKGAEEALKLTLAEMVSKRKRLPPPLLMDEIQELLPGALCHLAINLDDKAYSLGRTKRSVTLPNLLIHRLEMATGNISEYLTQAAEEKLSKNRVISD